MLTVSEIISATGGKLIRLGRDEFVGVSTDSRTIQPGEIFIALRGERFDGHDYYKEAMAKGGGAVINHHALCAEDTLPIADSDLSTTLITVDDTLLSLHSIAKHLRENFNGPVFAVVGSNGKTTTKELTYHVLSKSFKTLKTPSNNNNHIGLPRSMTFLTKDTECMVLEMGTNRPGDIRGLCEIARPNHAIITNIGYEHLEGFKDLKGVRDEELEVLRYVHTVIANGDDDFLMDGISRSFNKQVITFGIKNKDCLVRAKDINYSKSGMEFIVTSEGLEVSLKTPLMGVVNVYNCLAAISAGMILNIPSETIKEAIGSFSGITMRLEFIELKGVSIINDCYNANPSSVRAAIRELRAMAKNGAKTIAILGDMLELGAEGLNLHREIGKELTEAGIQYLIATGPMMKEALTTFKGPGLYAVDPETAAKEALKLIKPGDVLLIKGSRAMAMERATEVIRDAL